MGFAVKRHLRAIRQNLLQKSDAAGTCAIHVHSELLQMSDLEHYLESVERTQRADLRIARVAHGAPGVPAERDCMRESRGLGFGVEVHVSF
jgi:hypothetical protein